MNSEQGSGTLPGPLIIVAIGPSELLLVQEKDAINPQADAMLYELDLDRLLEEIKPLSLWLKFLYGLDLIIPPVLWNEEERKLRVSSYEARIRAKADDHGDK